MLLPAGCTVSLLGWVETPGSWCEKSVRSHLETREGSATCWVWVAQEQLFMYKYIETNVTANMTELEPNYQLLHLNNNNNKLNKSSYMK